MLGDLNVKYKNAEVLDESSVVRILVHTTGNTQLTLFTPDGDYSVWGDKGIAGLKTAIRKLEDYIDGKI